MNKKLLEERDRLADGCVQVVGQFRAQHQIDYVDSLMQRSFKKGFDACFELMEERVKPLIQALQAISEMDFKSYCDSETCDFDTNVDDIAKQALNQWR